LRKLTIEKNPRSGFEFFPLKILDKIQSIKLVELLKIDFKKSNIIGIFEIILKNGFKINDLLISKEIEIDDILSKDGSNFICFLKIIYKDEVLKKRLRGFDLDIIWTKLDLLSEDKNVISVIGENKVLNRFIKRIATQGEYKIISYSNSVLEKHNLLSILTNKQREIILEAKNNGYYEYPREINVNQLSERLGISKSTTIEHLRKAEKRIISHIFIGY
jgi:predicted DNA binding protein